MDTAWMRKEAGQHFGASGQSHRPYELHPRLKPILPQNPMVDPKPEPDLISLCRGKGSI